MKPVLTRQQLQTRKCRPLSGERGYGDAEIQAQLASLPGWSFDDRRLQRSFVFGDFHDTMAFVNALAWMIHGEDTPSRAGRHLQPRHRALGHPLGGRHLRERLHLRRQDRCGLRPQRQLTQPPCYRRAVAR